MKRVLLPACALLLAALVSTCALLLAALYDGADKDNALAAAAESDARRLAMSLNSYLTLYTSNGRAKDFSEKPDAEKMVRYLLDNAGDEKMTFGVALPYFSDPDAGNRAIDNIEYVPGQKIWRPGDSLNFKDPPTAGVYPAE